MGLKSTVRHYKTIKFNIKILLNIHNFLRAKIYIASLRFFLLLPPPQSENWIDACVCVCVCVYVYVCLFHCLCVTACLVIAWDTLWEYLDII